MDETFLGVGCTPWRPLVSAALPVAFAWKAWDLVQSDVRPDVPWSPPLCRWLLHGRRGTWCTARGRMYALASLGLRRSAGSFCAAGAALGALQGVGCTPWRPLVSGRRGTWCTARGRMYALASLGLRRSAGGFCVAGVGLGALQGVGCTPWRPLVSAALPVAFTWQTWDLVHCKGSDVRPGVPWSPPLCRWLLRGRCGAGCSAGGRMYAPGVPWSPPLATRSIYLRLHTFTLHPTSHHTKIISPHTRTRIHIRTTSACTSHI